jgi:UDP:flavonoid glycosyltransferase YjiC (YdhE family)
MARIAIATFGSYGDLHPYIAIGIELQARGHRVTIVTCPVYGPKVAAEGLGFHPARPDVPLADRALMESVFDARKGTERVFRYIASVVRENFEDASAAARQADVLITHPVAIGAMLAAKKLRLPWISSVLAPASFLSAYDPPVPAPTPWIVKFRALGPWTMRLLWRLARSRSMAWFQPVSDLARELGLNSNEHPLFEGSHSPSLVLALFSHYFAAPQPDWPHNTLVTGFPFYDRHHEHSSLAPELARFLADGPPPIVFTLGSSAVGAAGNFYSESLKAIEQLGARSLFLTGPHTQDLPEKLPSSAMAVDYAPHSEVFPHAQAIVHQGGIGTTAQAMKAGRPMLVVPFAHDQFDNASRARRLGVAEVLYRTRYHARRAEILLGRLNREPSYHKAAESLGSRIAAETGTITAADAIELFLSG